MRPLADFSPADQKLIRRLHVALQHCPAPPCLWFRLTVDDTRRHNGKGHLGNYHTVDKTIDLMITPSCLYEEHNPVGEWLLELARAMGVG